MKTNRSMLIPSVIPELAYANVREAAAWLALAFGFTERLRIGDHRVQLTYGDGAIVVIEGGGAGGRAVMVRVEDADAHCAHAREHGAAILREPTDYLYGERQYTARDPGGHIWTFSQSIADIDPTSWGGEVVE
ncbi:MAG: VOC family protein [Acidobacteria bacterium]|nr:VOC family protein [Acidobacteriota bacterium]